MSDLKTQFGVSVSADFGDDQWTFEMPESFEVTAGNFAILPEDKYLVMVAVIERCRNFLNVHPENEMDSEMEGLAHSCIEALNEVK